MRFNNEKGNAMKRLILVLTISLAAIAAANAQTNYAPRTYFDAANATADALLIKGSSTIGTLSSQISYPVEIRVERLTNPQTTNTIYAVSLRTHLDKQTTQIDYIDYDELDAVIQSVQYISQASSTVTPLDNFETVFRTRSGLSIAKIGRGNKVTISMTPGYVNVVRNQMASFVLDDLGRYLTAAKAKIDAVVASGQ
jgi:hypothetical protein